MRSAMPPVMLLMLPPLLMLPTSSVEEENAISKFLRYAASSLSVNTSKTIASSRPGFDSSHDRTVHNAISDASSEGKPKRPVDMQGKAIDLRLRAAAASREYQYAEARLDRSTSVTCTPAAICGPVTCTTCLAGRAYPSVTIGGVPASNLDDRLVIARRHASRRRGPARRWRTLSMQRCSGRKHPKPESFAAFTTASTDSVVRSPRQTITRVPSAVFLSSCTVCSAISPLSTDRLLQEMTYASSSLL
mmetsp:Transcript_34966/g.75772  ORF Transcript_34966/g.75772 Transcript_34966/m.75772 type:complete len:247 (+) Transcript_34966:214-954(+)